MANTLPFEKKCAVVSALCEGASIRGIERMLGVNRETTQYLGVRTGQACASLLDRKMRDLPCEAIEADEVWAFIGSKQRNVTAENRAKGYGDAWVFLALDPVSKAIPSFVVGPRDRYHAIKFMDDLASRLKKRIQLSTDKFAAYADAAEIAFGVSLNYAQLVKTYSFTTLGKAAAVRYSPAEVVKVEKVVVQGTPDLRLTTTSHVEKFNHTLRMGNRRLSRLTNAFSKKPENFEASVALWLGYYNFVKFNSAVRMTPCMALGVESSPWTVANLLEACGE
jgi:IS1 family transposase